MKNLKQDLNDAIAENVIHDSYSLRKIDGDTGAILEPYCSIIKFGFQVNAKNREEAEKLILHEAKKFLNGIFES